VNRTPDLQVRSLTKVVALPCSAHRSPATTGFSRSFRDASWVQDGLGVGTVRAQSSGHRLRASSNTTATAAARVLAERDAGERLLRAPAGDPLSTRADQARDAGQAQGDESAGSVNDGRECGLLRTPNGPDSPDDVHLSPLVAHASRNGHGRCIKQKDNSRITLRLVRGLLRLPNAAAPGNRSARGLIRTVAGAKLRR
jgi:hypothetical protein